MAIRLRQSGHTHFTLFEKSERLGGTWFDNQYPGAGCDVPGHFYCFSFEKNPDWMRRYPLQNEILRYLEHCADKYDIRRHIHFGREIVDAVYDDAQATWRLTTKNGEVHVVDVLIAGTGQLNRARIPNIPGMDSFRGKMVHSARWNIGADLAGENVAVIGSGASAIQLTPALARTAKSLTVFQRSPNYILPRQDRAYSSIEKWLFRNLTFVMALYRAWTCTTFESRWFMTGKGSIRNRFAGWLALQNMRSTIKDPVLRQKLTPDFPAFCKRTLVSDEYYETMLLPHVSLETTAIDRIDAHGVRTKDGKAHPADTIVFATGFDATSFLAPIRIIGRGGQELSSAWKDGAEAYKGILVSGFPNLFLLYGPNTNLGHSSIIFMIECQTNYILHCLRILSDTGARALDVKREHMDAFNRSVQLALSKTAFAAGCNSWYKTDSGKITNNWSGLTLHYWWITRRPALSALELIT